MTYRIGFVVEDTLGHVTHLRNLQRWTDRDTSVLPTWYPIPYWEDDRWSSTPIVRNVPTLYLSLRARDRLKRSGEPKFDALFYHTQSTALFATRAPGRPPIIMSLDATPLNMDSIAAGYNHRPDGASTLGRLKMRLYRRAFQSAAALTTWSRWAKNSLVRDYAVSPEKVEVIPPGVDLGRQSRVSQARQSGKSRLLFVGGDFVRKGGRVLLDALKLGLTDRCDVDIVTDGGELLPESGGIRVHRGLRPGDPILLDLFSAADILVFPTLADCTPIAILEAMAAGLAVVASDVGAICEQVVDGETGLLVPPGNPVALAGAVASLLDDPARRLAHGAAGRRRAEELFDGRRNYGAILDLIKRCIDSHRYDVAEGSFAS